MYEKSDVDEAAFWGKYLLKSVRSSIYNILIARTPDSGKTPLARALLGSLLEMNAEHLVFNQPTDGFLDRLK